MITQRLLLKVIASVLLLPAAIISACTPEERQYGSGGSSSSSSSSSGGMQCASDTDCGASSECQTFACVNGQCNVTFTSMGTPVAVQEIGDCQSNVCDGKGYIVKVEDLADPTDDGITCTLDACVGTETQHGFLAAGTACNGSQYCDGFGMCVECLEGSHCASSICSGGFCATAECTDTVKNGIETDVDCGGLQCPRCSAGATCTVDQDCKSLICSGGICTEATCEDAVMNGQETDIDCGGPDCKPCPTGKVCNAGLDCTSKVCKGNICQDPSCNDQVKNGYETDVDCGGGVPCTKCSLGQSCYVGKDCLSGNCCVPEFGMLGTCLVYGETCALRVRSEISQ
ncbi:MAG: hypothetical protein IPM54_18575 [Polyangiaceae bacterium]|nr:hypothetical protein [Polyangiaceae bacterium]